MSRFISICVTVLSVAPFCSAADFPVTGKAVKGFEPVDRAAQEFLARIDGQAMVVAVSRNGVILYSRGFGWSDEGKQSPTQPDTLMRMASITKSVTAAAVKTLIRGGKLKADTKVFDLVKLTPPDGAEPDARLKSITVQHLLDHKGGWDRDKSFDPMFKARDAEKALGLKGPAAPTDIVRWMLGQPLQFEPGERSVYSNFGYCVLGRAIDKASGKSYGDYVRDAVLRPAQIKDMQLGRNSPKDRDPREVWYLVPNVDVELMNSNGGYVASAPAVCQFMHKYWLNGDPRKGEAEFEFFGSLPGTTALARQRKDGYNIAVLCNQRRDEKMDEDNAELKKAMDAAVDKVKVAGKR
jgi:N-acyl-D-amino-acid deacylase